MPRVIPDGSTGDIQGRLRQAKQAGRWTRWKMSGPPLIAGLTFGCAALIDWYAWFAKGTLVCLGAPAVLATLLALLPSDRRLIKGLFATSSVVFGLLALIFLAFFPYGIAVAMSGECEGGPCWLWAAGGCIFGAFGLTTGWLVYRHVVGLCRLSPPKLLDDMFRSFGTYWRNMSIISACFFVTNIIAGQNRTSSDDRSGLLLSIALNTFAYAGTAHLFRMQDLRTRVHSYLLSFSEELSLAAGIAAMLGAGSADGVQAKALRSFRCVSLDRVTQEAMAQNAPDPGLRQHTEAAQMGNVDCFLSHSWHDPAQLKWDALQQFRTDFVSQHGREPRVWIDKYCIDQDNVAASLECLPCFLAGCTSLLVIAGDTYTARLWCIMEVFVYLAMRGFRGNMEGVILMVVGDDATKQQRTLESFLQFDAGNARCAVVDDTERLQGIIEEGFGGLGGFNLTVRQMFKNIANRDKSWRRNSLTITDNADAPDDTAGQLNPEISNLL